jgi:hypothetical protein
MGCLRCGYCCREIWPGNHNDGIGPSEPCPNLETRADGLCSCKIYPTRPKECKQERMGAEDGRPCAIGLVALDNGKIPRPTNRCMNCGNPCYDGDMFCTPECEGGTLSDLNTFVKDSCKPGMY